MERISDAAEGWLHALLDEFWIEIANHEIGSEHVRYASGAEARMAMLRQAYLRGRSDALTTPLDYDQMVQQVEAANAKTRT